MGLDVYVGTLTRYYANAWETVVQSSGRAAGVPVTVLRAGQAAPGGDAEQRLEEARDMVEAWRRGLARALADDLGGRGLDWSEGDDQPYFTDKPDWSGHGALVCLAAYAEHPELRQRERADNWTDEPAWQASAAQEDPTPFQQILFPELWLPVDADLVFTAEDPAGNEVTMGSVPRLLAALRALAAQTFGGGEAEWAEWRRAGPPETDDFDAEARFGLAVMLGLVADAQRHGLCVTLDY